MNRIGSKPHAHRPRVVAFGGGKGGVGRSTICAEMARSLAHRDHDVLCVDAAWGCPTLNTLLNTAEPQFESDISPLGTDDSHVADFIETTGVDGVWLASVAAARAAPFTRPRLDPDQMVAQLHALDFDWVFLDLGPGVDPLDVGLFALSDIPLLIASPEPSSVRVATQFLRSAMVEAIRFHRDGEDDAELLRDILSRQPLQLDAGSLRRAAVETPIAAVVDEALERFESYLVVNLVREGAEQDLGFVIAHAWFEALSVFPRFLTSVDYENRRWFYHRRTTGRNAVRGDETLSRDIEKLSDMASDISVIDAKFPRPIPSDDDLHPALRLGISPDSSRNEVRQHCRRLWEGYKRERAVDVIFSDPDSRTEIAEELESLYRKVLTLPSDTFDTVRDLEQPPEADVGLSAASSNPSDSSAATAEVGLRDASDARSTSPTDPMDARSGRVGAAASSSSSDVEADASPPRNATDEQARPAADSESDEADARQPLPEVGPPEVSEPGELIERLRARETTSLQELSRRTNIGVKYLTAVEDADVEKLPRPVYLREYLRKVAHTFDVDPEALVDAYLERLDDPPF